MPRKPWRIRARHLSLSDAMKFFLETGEYCLRERFPEARDRLRIFQLANPSAREKLRRVWLSFRDEIIADWRRQGLPGVPWAETATQMADMTNEDLSAEDPGFSELVSGDE